METWDNSMIGNCFKKKNTSVVGVPQPPAHPSNDSTPIPTVSKTRDNSWEKYAYAKTSAFEGSGIDQVTDNFDGQGISLGGLQWCVGQGSLQEKILKPYFKDVKPSTPTEEILFRISSVSVGEGILLCKKYFLSGSSLKTGVLLELQSFCRKAEAIQMLAAQELFDRAWSMCEDNQMLTLKSFCFFFDICVQNGSLAGVPKPKADMVKYLHFIENEGGKNTQLWRATNPTDEILILSLWIAGRAKNNQWRSDVIARKCTIAHGVGYVHDTLFRFPEFNTTI